MNINKFTQNSMQAVQNCEKIAYDYGNQELAQEHLLYALVTQDDSLILNLLEKMSIQGPLFINRVEELLNKRPKVQGGQVFVGQDLNQIFLQMHQGNLHHFPSLIFIFCCKTHGMQIKKLRILLTAFIHRIKQPGNTCCKAFKYKYLSIHMKDIHPYTFNRRK